jgi:hypothetical protein
MKSLKINSLHKTFSFSVSGKDLVSLLMKVMDVTGYSSKSDTGRHHLLVSTGQDLFVVGYSDETHGILKVPHTSIKGKGSFILSDPEVFVKLLKSRPEIEFSYQGALLEYRSVKGKFTGDLNTVKITDEHVARVNTMFGGLDTGSSLSPELMLRIREGVKYTRLVDTYQGTVILSFIQLEGNSLTVSTSDELHLAHYTAKLKSRSAPFRLAIPALLFSTVDKFTGQEDANFSMTSKGFVVYGDDYLVGFPPLQADQSKFQQVPTYMSMLDKPVCTFTTNVDLIDIQKSLSSLAQKGSRYLMSISKRGLVELSLKTDSGSGSDSIRVNKVKLTKSKIEVRIDPIIFADLLELSAKDVIPMSFYSRDNGDSIKMYTIESNPSPRSSLTLMGSVSQ